MNQKLKETLLYGGAAVVLGGVLYGLHRYLQQQAANAPVDNGLIDGTTDVFGGGGEDFSSSGITTLGPDDWLNASPAGITSPADVLSSSVNPTTTNVPGATVIVNTNTTPDAPVLSTTVPTDDTATIPNASATLTGAANPDQTSDPGVTSYPSSQLTGGPALVSVFDFNNPDYSTLPNIAGHSPETSTAGLVAGLYTAQDDDARLKGSNLQSVYPIEGGEPGVTITPRLTGGPALVVFPDANAPPSFYTSPPQSVSVPVPPVSILTAQTTTPTPTNIPNENPTGASTLAPAVRKIAPHISDQ